MKKQMPNGTRQMHSCLVLAMRLGTIRTSFRKKLRLSNANLQTKIGRMMRKGANGIVTFWNQH